MPLYEDKHNAENRVKVSAELVQQAWFGTDNVVADEYTSYFRSVICFGKVRFVEDEAEKFELHDLLVDKYSPDFKEGVYEMFETRIKWMGAFVVELEHVSGKEAIELAVPGYTLPELGK